MKVAVLSDIHSNVVALDAVLAAVGTVDAVWHLGDVVGYGPEPDAVVERLRAVGAVGVRGNHDDAVVSAVEPADFVSYAATAVRWTRKHISPATREFLESLPLTLAPAGLDVTLVHGMPESPLSSYLHSALDAADSLSDVESRHCIVGHTHVPIAFRESAPGVMRSNGPMTDGDDILLGGARHVLNPGSVGQPRDGDPRAAFMLIDTERGRVTWRRVAYDVAAVQGSIRVAGLPGWLADRLGRGQ
jgi:diadenosine tetraphosphatase ApaH/serine/threonine PP2A family protein phosphatase